MSKKTAKKIQHYALELERDGGLFGVKIDDIVIGKNRIDADGKLDYGDFDLVVKFSKKEAINDIYFSIYYDAVDARSLQSWEFSNYKKFEKAIEGRYEDFYEKAVEYLGSEKGLNKGIDMIERIPGMEDLDITLWNYETYETSRWG